MSISLIKKVDNSKENQKQFQKLLLSKQSYIVNITDYLQISTNDILKDFNN